MADLALNGRRILIVEDEFLLADDMQQQLSDAGAEVIGPVAAVDAALKLVSAAPALDAAVLDVNLQGELIFPVADLLAARGVPFVFTTGFDAAMIPERFGQVLRCEKPLRVAHVARALDRLMREPPGPALILRAPA